MTFSHFGPGHREFFRRKTAAKRGPDLERGMVVPVGYFDHLSRPVRPRSAEYRCGLANPNPRSSHSMLSPMSGETTTPIGEATFDAADRLAIINLIGAYVQLYDAGRLDEWQTVFADAAEVRFFPGPRREFELGRNTRHPRRPSCSTE